MRATMFDPPEVADVCGRLGLDQDDPADRDQVEMIREFFNRPIPPRPALQAFLDAVPKCDCPDGTCHGHAIAGEDLATANEAMERAITRINLDYRTPRPEMETTDDGGDDQA